MPTEKELMLKQSDAETTYQKKLTAGTNITIDPVTNIISSAGGGSTVQYTDNTPNGESVGILAINGQSHPVHIPRFTEGTGITINKDITTNVYTISLSGGGGGTTKTYMGETNPDELVGEDGDLYFKYHKIETDIPTELTLPSLPDDATVPFPITNFNSYDSFTFYYTDGNGESHNKKVDIGDIVISDDPANTEGSNIYTWNSYRYIQATQSTNGEGLVLRVCGNCLYKLEANVTEVDLGIDKSYAKVEDTWLPSGEQVEANPEETSQTPLTKIKIDGVTYYIAAGGSGTSAVEKTQAEYDVLTPSQKENGSIYMVQDDGGLGNYEYYTNQAETIVVRVNKTTNEIEWFFVDYTFTGGSVEQIPSELMAYLPASTISGNAYDTSLQTMMGYVAINAQGGFGLYPTDYSREISGTVKCLLKNTDGTEQANTYTDPYEGTGDAVNRIYYMGTEYANTNGGSDGDGSQELISYDTIITTSQYGWWIAEDKDGNILDPDQYELVAVTPIVNNSSSWVGAWDGAFYVNSVDGTTYRYDVTFVNINDGGYIRTSRTWDVKVIYRDKNAAGGGSGSTVVPNPEEEPTDTLNTIEIDGIVYNIEGSSEGEGIEIYSEDEYIVGKWIDGKKLYQKTIDFGAMPSQGNSKSVAHNISDIDKIISWEAFGVNQSGQVMFVPNVSRGNVASQTSMSANSTNVNIFNGSSSDITSAFNGYVTIRYTKTVETDAPAWGGSVTNNYANFIDTDNVIQAFTQISDTSEHTYTATEDCIITYYVASQGDTYIKINNILVGGNYSQAVSALCSSVAVKKGQTFSFQQSYAGSSSSGYTVYGISYGSGDSSSESSIDYSTDEQDTGIKWIDGSSIYQKTIVLTNLSLQQGSNNFALSSFNISNVQYVIEEPKGFLKVNASDIRTYPFGSTYSLRIYGTPTNLVIERTGNDLSLAELTVTIKYTKTAS